MSSTDRKHSETTEIEVLTGEENITFFRNVMNGFFPLRLIKSYITKHDVGLGNADNTADINKPVSIPQQEALDGKADFNHLHSSQDITDFQSAVNSNVDPKLALKANIDHTHLSEDVTDLTESINNNVDPKLLQKSDIDHTHLAEDVTDLTQAINSNVDPKLSQKSDIGHTHPDLGGSVDLPDSGVLKVHETIPGTIDKAIPSIDYVHVNKNSIFKKSQTPSLRTITSIATEYNSQLNDEIIVNWDILNHQVLFIGADYFIDKINIVTPSQSVQDIIDNSSLDITIDEGNSVINNWEKLIGTQYQIIIMTENGGTLEYLTWEEGSFLWPDGIPINAQDMYVGVQDGVTAPNLIILNFELVSKPTVQSIVDFDFEFRYTSNPGFGNVALAYLGMANNLKPQSNSGPAEM